jgi:hypothetical protein
MRDQLHFVQEALLSSDNPQHATLIDAVSDYYWNKYAGLEGLTETGVKYGIRSYVKDLRAYFLSVAHLQLRAIYLLSWAVELDELKAETKRTIGSLDKQAKALSDLVPHPIDFADKEGNGDAFFL